MISNFNRDVQSRKVLIVWSNVNHRNVGYLKNSICNRQLPALHPFRFQELFRRDDTVICNTSYISHFNMPFTQLTCILMQQIFIL